LRTVHLDFQTLYAVAAISLAATSAIVALAAHSYSGVLARVGYLWAMSVGFAMLGYAFVALRGTVPDAVSILGGHATGVAATCGFYHACLRLTNRKTPLLLIYAPVALATASAAYFSFQAPNLSIRVAIFSGLAALPMGLCAVTLAPRRGEPGLLTSYVGSFGFALGCVVLVLRAAVRLTHDPAIPLRVNFASSPIEQLSILLTFVVFSALSLLFLIICNDRLHRELERLATLDPVTERFNRRTIEGLGRREVANARRRHSDVTVALIDIDHFKQINDRYGHAAGDTALRSTVVVLEQNLRARDVLGRYGGDELIVVMPDTDADRAASVCERLRELLAYSRFVGASAPLTLTVSIGVASARGNNAEFEQLVQAADAALYDAKRRGRNRTCVAEGPDPARKVHHL
jgi:diguanylate cyclase (GGDEF)-like protein